MERFQGNWETGERRSFRRILVVGGGRAGVAAAEELRRQGFGGEVVVMCDEPDAPYDRPSCSKGLLSGHKRPKDARMPVQDDLAIHWEMDRRAVHLDPVNRLLVADTDEKYEYDGLVIATGARPLWPEGWPSQDEPGLHGLHGIGDAWRLRHALRRAKRVAVVGGGLTGCEVACTVRSLARECVLIDSKQQVMSRALGEVVGRYVTEEVARDGVELRLGRRVRKVERGRKGWVLELDDRSEVTADLVVATIGERPDTQWLADTGFDISDGVLCDEHLRVVGGEDVVACGTVARWPNLRYSAKPRRVGQWIMALEQGRAAAASLLRSDHPARPAALVPRYWSEQFGLRIQVCGEVPTDGSAEMTVSRQRPGRKDTARAGVLVGYHRDGEQVGLVGVNAVRAFTTTARMMLAAPPKLVSPRPSGPPALPAGPSPARPELPGPAQAELPASPRHRAVIDADPATVLDHGPYPADEYQPVPAHSRRGYDADRGYGPVTEPQPALGYQPEPDPRQGYGPDPRDNYGPDPRYGYGPDPRYGYDPEPVPAHGYEPPPPRYRHESEPPPYGYQPEPPPPPYGYEPEPPPPYGYEPEPPPPYGYQPEPPPYHRYEPEPVARYASPEPPSRYGPEPAALPPSYGYDQGPRSYADSYGPPPPGYQPPEYDEPPRGDYPPGYFYSEPGSDEGHAPPAPVSPSPRRLSPRDRFATDQFAAVR